MRNIFDQYSQPENRLTHALVSCLAADSKLLRKFVEWVTGEGLPSTKNLEIVEQRLPGEEEVPEDDAEKRGLPDAWIHDGNTWAVVLENKIASPLKLEQLECHRRVAERRGFTQLHLAAIVIERSKAPSLNDVKVLEWRELYSWLRGHMDSQWVHRMIEYMEVLEGKLVADQYLTEGTLTVFSGIPFGKDSPYNYHEAKRLLRLMLNEMRRRQDLQRELGMDPEGEGRPAITGREARRIWDFLPLVQAKGAKNFTEYPHLTLSIWEDWTFAHVTIPNGIKKEYRDNLLSRGKEGFFELLGEVRANVEKSLGGVEEASPWVNLVQRHYPFQRAEPILDAGLEFDLRTAFPVSGASGVRVKHQPQWLEAVYEALSRKRSNLQMAVGVRFAHDRGESTKSRDILDHIANAWLACKPLIRAIVA